MYKVFKEIKNYATISGYTFIGAEPLEIIFNSLEDAKRYADLRTMASNTRYYVVDRSNMEIE